MGTEENKAVVRRFTDEVLTGGNLSMADELIVPDFKGFEVSDISSFKAVLTAMWARFTKFEVNIDELLAEGDSVVARCSYRLTRSDGSTTTGRGLSYYRLADGKIMKSETMTVPDIVQELWQREGTG
jgi:predicted SnoaL-like aldol condensation-catalyzing enzyme